ncbi:MAG: S-layer homology domain-containing protein [Chloroflexota bacterium]
MNTKLLSFLLLLVLAFGMFPTVTQAQAKAETVAVSDRDISPAGMLNADGTLALDGSFNGALDLSGYNVQIDPQRGPVFSPAESIEASAAPGEWAALGSGGGAVNRYIMTILINGTDVYVGGNFTNLANIPEADYLAKWDTSTQTWSAISSNGAGNGALNSVVYALAYIGTDLYIGGSFRDAANLPNADFIVKRDTVGDTWSAVGPKNTAQSALDSNVYALTVNGANLYVGGRFTNAASIAAADYLAKWDTSTQTWSELGNDGAGNGAIKNTVNALAISETNLYVGGGFTNAANIPEADYLANWDTSTQTWSALGNDGAGDGAIKSYVYALVISETDLYVGGSFTDAANIPEADYLAKWDTLTQTWSSLGSNGAGNGALGGAVFALTVSGTNLYVGGQFWSVNNLVNAGLVKWDISKHTWSAVGNNPFPTKWSPSIRAIAIQGSLLFAGGYFMEAAGTLQADFIAQWDGNAWSPLGSSINGEIADPVSAIAIIGTDVYVGGDFVNISNHGVHLPAADYIAKWDGSNWSAVGPTAAGGGALGSGVVALAVSGTDLYVGGYFTDAAYITAADYLVKWDTTAQTWSALGSDGAGNGALKSNVYALAVNGDDLYVGGNFTNAANLAAADYLAKWDTSAQTWSALGSDGAGEGALKDRVNALVFNGTNLYVGGWFTNAANIPEADYIAKWDTSAQTWSALGNDGAGDGALKYGVWVLAVGGADLFAGGWFTNAANIPEADYIAKWDISTQAWSALGSDGAGNGALNSNVFALVVNGDDLYVGGRFTNAANLGAADYLARWDGSNWSAVGDNGSGNGALDNSVSALAISGPDLYVGGNFEDINNHGVVLPAADHIAAHNISTDNLPPTIASITRASANPTSAPSVDFTVTFSENVTGVDAGDFDLALGGHLLGMGITAVNGSGSSYTVTVSTGKGDGTLRLEVPATAAIADSAGNPLGGLPFTVGQEYTVSRPVTFADVPGTYWAWQHIERLYSAGITGGCTSTPLNYCPETAVTRAQMAVFLLVAKHGAGYNPPAATGLFSDVPASNGFAPWIEQMAAEGITGGCGGGKFCPNAAVTREQMAVFLLVAEHGAGYNPPAAVGVFSDVPADNPFAKWIEQLANEGITGGCGGGKFCPQTPVTRAQMAVFLVAAFNLP